MSTRLAVPASPLSGPRWLAVLAAALATFSVVTTEMLAVGLLTPIAETFATSAGSAGLMVSVPALLAAFFAPLVVLACGGMDRRWILCGLLGLLVVANTASAVAPNLAWMLAARVLLGLCMGGIWAIAGGLAARLVPSDAVGLATSIIFGGVAAASVLGVPIGALIGELVGWRWAFASLAVFSALVLVMQLLVMPPLPVSTSASLTGFARQLGNQRVQLGLLLTLLLVAGHFAAFTFVRPLLQLAGYAGQWVGALLFAYGIAGIFGNFLAGPAAARRTTLTLAIIALGLTLTPALLLGIGESPVAAGVILLIWGLAYGGVSVGLMTWMMRAAPQAVEIVGALYVGVFNIGIALGAWAGGQAVDGWGLIACLFLAMTLAGGALVLVLGTARSAPHTAAPSDAH